MNYLNYLTDWSSLTHNLDFLQEKYYAACLIIKLPINMKENIHNFYKNTRTLRLWYDHVTISFHSNHIIFHDFKHTLEIWRVHKWTFLYTPENLSQRILWTWSQHIFLEVQIKSKTTVKEEVVSLVALKKKMFDLFLEYLHPCNMLTYIHYSLCSVAHGNKCLIILR